MAFIDLAVVQPDGTDADKHGLVGVEHIAYTYSSLEAMFENYMRLNSNGILPYWCIHHGITISMYYADPDGNQIEFQVDCFESAKESNADIRGPSFGDKPVSPIRGTLSEA